MKYSFRLAMVALGMAGGGLAARPAVAAEAAPVTECDRLAQPPRDAFGAAPALADGVTLAKLRWPAARAACEQAMKDFPGEVRFVALSARAAYKAGDMREALRKYRAAADEGVNFAQFTLGVMYDGGEAGLPHDEREAEHWYRLAAEQGFPAAQSNLGMFYATGHGGLQRSDRESVIWLRKAADQNDAGGMTNLGKMYAEGRGGLPRDLGEAVRLWRLAAELGSDEARGNLRKAGRS